MDAAAEQAPGLLQELLLKPQNTPQRIDGVMQGRLVRKLDADMVEVEIPALHKESVRASLICAADLIEEGAAVGIMFAQGNPDMPLVMGAFHASPPAQAQALEVRCDDTPQRLVLEAEQELELRCGEACILLTADGRIILRGNYISSHASASQRIRGGSVQIN
ncbi:hypothetical protein V8J88_06420 [Massilia sp. W12]|uniref:hypothetical protein n=1 Tax=Massilia sp. W12 TaxID=3126507 RepID=UPI0030D17D2D